MSAAAAVAGWAAAALLLLAARRREADRAERIARACHELRGALHAAGMALHGAPGGERVRAARAELDRAALALADLASAPAGRAAADGRAVRVDVGALVARHAAAWRAVAAGHGARLRILLPEGPAVVEGDPLRLAQAAANLVSNAAEHGGGAVELRVAARDGRVLVDVRDDGPGLPRPVAAITRRARSGRGARGRGLAIAGEVAARHGGRVAAVPDPAGGRVVLELPEPTP